MKHLPEKTVTVWGIKELVESSKKQTTSTKSKFWNPFLNEKNMLSNKQQG